MYGLLLELYPPEYLKQHRAEMLQNFEDLEHASSSKAALWLFVGKDLMTSLISHYVPTREGQMKSVRNSLNTLRRVFILTKQKDPHT